MPILGTVSIQRESAGGRDAGRIGLSGRRPHRISIRLVNEVGAVHLKRGETMDVIETLQARISALEVELSRIAGMAEQGAKMAQSDMDKRGLQAILRTAEAALESKDAAPVEIVPADSTPDLTDDEIEIAKAEMDAFYGRAEDDEPDYDAHIAAQERAFNDSLDQMEDEREAQDYFEEHGVEPGGTCPYCKRTDTGCVCDNALIEVNSNEATFAVGQRVIINSDSCPAEYKGKVGRIQKSADRDGDYYIEFEHVYAFDYFKSYELSPAPETKRRPTLTESALTAMGKGVSVVVVATGERGEAFKILLHLNQYRVVFRGGSYEDFDRSEIEPL